MKRRRRMKRRSKRKRRRRRTERKEVRCPLHASPSSERGSVTGSWRDGSTVSPNLSFFGLSLFFKTNIGDAIKQER